MTRVSFKAVAFGLFFCLLSAFAAPLAWAEEEQEVPKITPFKLRTVGGEEYNLESRKGSPLTIVTFFATWNPRSPVILKELHKLEDKLGGKGLALIAVNSETETLPPDFSATLAEFLKVNGVDFTVLLDPGLSTYRAWGVKALPTTFLLDKDLKVLAYIPGAPSTIHETLFEDSMKALGLATEHPDANAAPTRYQAARDEMLHYGLAEKLLERGSPHKAIDKIEIVVEKDPKFPDAQALKGVILLSISEEGDTSVKARAAFARAAELDPKLPVALFGMAYFAAVDGDSKASIEKAREALAMKAWGFAKKPEDAKLTAYSAQLDRAAAFLAEGKTSEANTELGAVLEDFVVVRKRVKVDQKRMKELKDRTEGNQQKQAGESATPEAKPAQAPVEDKK